MIFKKVRDLEFDMERLLVKVKQLECEHPEVYFVNKEWHIDQASFGGSEGKKTCSKCGKTLAYYKDRLSYVQARLEHLEYVKRKWWNELNEIGR